MLDYPPSLFQCLKIKQVEIKDSILMDKQTIIHAAAESAAFIALTVYVINENSNLRKEIEQLKTDLQIVAKHQMKVDNQHNVLLDNLVTRTNKLESAPKPQVHQISQPKPQNDMLVQRQQQQMAAMQQQQLLRQQQQQQQQAQARAQTQPQRIKKQVKFIEEDEDDMLEHEYGGQGEEEDEEEYYSESEEEPQPPPKLIANKKPKRPTMVKNPNPPPKRRGARDMDDLKAKAAQMRAEAGDEE